MNVAARDVERRVVIPDRFLVRAVEQAVHLAVGVVVELDLADALLTKDLGRQLSTAPQRCVQANAVSGCRELGIEWMFDWRVRP
jgi:hypothetical protein